MLDVENKGGTNVPDGDAVVYLTGSNYAGWSGAGSFEYLDFEQDMKATDVVRQIPADSKRFTKSLEAPALTPGQTRQDTFIARVYHEYETTANGNVWIYSETEAEAARTAGRALYRPSFTYTRGPVGIEVSVSPDPVIIYGTDSSFTLYVKLSNLGAGTIYAPDILTYTGESRSVSLTTEQINRVDVEVGAGTLEVGSGCEGAQELIAGKDTTLVCEVTIPGSIPSLASYDLGVSVSYGYYTERTTIVTLQGRETAAECTTDDDCPACEECVAGDCEYVAEGEDPKDDCTDPETCDGAGGCA